MKFWGFTLFHFCEKFGTILEYISVQKSKEIYSYSY